VRSRREREDVQDETKIIIQINEFRAARRGGERKRGKGKNGGNKPICCENMLITYGKN